MSGTTTNLLLFKYNPNTDGDQTFNIDDALNNNWDIIDDFAGSLNLRNIGEIVASTIPLTDAGLHLLDGALLQYGSYQAFIDYIAGLYDSGDYTAIFDTEANWQSAVTTYGVCGKFVYNSVNNTVRLPKITGFIEGTNVVSALGDLVEAGLPNITGGFNISNVGENATAQTQGALLNGVANYPRSSGGVGASATNLRLDASNSNSIYGNSNTVQPQSIKVLYYIVVATSTKTDIQVDIDEIATDLNGKADKDGSNITQSFSTNLVGNMSDTANIYMAGMAMPSNTYDDLTLGSSGAVYTAPANGWVVIKKVAGGSDKYVNIYVRNTDESDSFAISSYGNTSGANIMLFVPIQKSRKFVVNYNATGTTTFFRFIYAVGSESEA